MSPMKILCLTSSFLGLLTISIANPLEARQTTASSSASIATISSSTDGSTTSTGSAGTSSPISTSSVTTSPSAAPSAATTISGTNDEDQVTATQTFSGTVLPAGVTSVPDSVLSECTEDVATSSGFFPFCEPVSGSQKIVGSTYYVTWFPGNFTQGTSISIQLNYPNTTETPWHSDPTDKNLGFVYMPIDDGFLQGNSKNNLTLSLVANNPNETVRASAIAGPTITVVQPATSHFPPPPPNTIGKLGLELGLPIGLAVILFILAVLYFGMRKHRRIGLGSVMGGRRRGYGIGKSRGQRIGGKRGPIGLSEQEFPTADEPDFRDEPGGNDMELQEHRYRDGEGNAFREEVERQKTTR